MGISIEMLEQRGTSVLVAHTNLVLPLQCEDVGDFPKRQTQRDNFRLRRLVGQLSDVKHSRRRRLLHPQLLTVAAIGRPV